ncbi:MAG TPA: hypothetical protein VIA45_02645 [Thermoanaerobaculia bacterium]
MTRATSGRRVETRRWQDSPWTMAAVGLAVRLVVLYFTYADRLNPARDHWTFGWETARVARSIATGHGFSSPYPEPTGPTALMLPVYTYLVAGVFRLFGTYSTASAVIMLTLNDLFSALTCVPVFFIALRVFGLRTARWAGWFWAFFPWAIALANTTVWNTLLTALLFSLAILATLRLERSTAVGAWLGYGVLWGVAALTDPALLSSLPFLGGWVWLRHRRRGESCTAAAAAAALVFFCMTGPWIWRCSQIYGRFVAFRGGVGLELLVGNTDPRVPSNFNVLPGDDPAELARIRRLGEPAYMAERQREAWEVISRRPWRFAGLALRRVLYTWTGFWNAPLRWNFDGTGLPNLLTYSFVSLLAFTGLFRAIRERRDGVAALAIPLVLFPLTYYLTHSDARYRHPIDPIVAIFAAYAATSRRPDSSTVSV